MSDVPEQNPPLDIPNKVDQAGLEKFGLKTDDAVLAEEKDTPLSKDGRIRVHRWWSDAKPHPSCSVDAPGESHVLYWFW